MPTKDLETQIRDYLRAHPGSSFRTLSAVIKAPRSSVWDALLRMQRRGAVTRRDTGKSVTYTANTVIKKPREYKELQAPPQFSYTATITNNTKGEYKAKEPLPAPNVRPIEIVSTALKEPAAPTARCPYCGTTMLYNARWKHYTCRNLMCCKVVPLSHLTPMQPVAKKVR